MLKEPDEVLAGLLSTIYEILRELGSPQQTRLRGVLIALQLQLQSPSQRIERRWRQILQKVHIYKTRGNRQVET